MIRLLNVKRSLPFSMKLLLTLVLLLPAARPAMARDTRIAPGRHGPTAQLHAQGPTDSAELETFLDDFFARAMAEYHIAGAAVAVVKDGTVFLAKGYGSADLEHAIPVDPETTIFRIGSVGKLFTWTAVMQLVEQGKLGLDTDISTYLDFRIPDTYPQPVTLKHLLTHTSGFDDRWLETVVADASALVPARDWLVTNSPGRVRPPGEAAAYSNYNAMLAGYIVARVSGQPYAEYIQRHIFDPLGMVHATAQSPLPPALRPGASVGYTYVDGAFQAFPDYIVQPAGLPSGAHQASAMDMARFMVAHLEQGRSSDAPSAAARILEARTVRQMQRTLYAPDPRLLGMAYGFTDISDNGQRTLGHEGYSPPMSSQLLLLPDQRLGIFVAYNSLDAREGGLTTQHMGFQRAFFDHYYPAAAAAPRQPPVDGAERASQFAGLYREANDHATTPEKVRGLFGALEVGDPGDGTLVLPVAGREVRYVEVAPRYFRQVDGPLALVFRADERGRITHLFADVQPQQAFVKLHWYETPGFNLAVALGCVLVFLSMVPVAIIRFMRNRRAGGSRGPVPRGARVASGIILGISLLNLLFLAGIALWFRTMRPSELHGISMIVEIVLGLAVVAAVLTAGALVATVVAWKKGYWGIAGRAYYTLVTLAAVAFVWFLNSWNWLGWRY